MIRTFAFGGVFGFLLVRAGATRYDVIARMFLFEDPHLAIVMAAAVAVAAVGIHALGASRWATAPDGGCPLGGESAPRPTLVPGALLFGIGWGLTGTCPGTALAQLGEGRLVGLFTAAGVFLGSWIFAARERRATPGGPASG